jgi:LmbE family N-acetylglucosaminyl deacetylase
MSSAATGLPASLAQVSRHLFLSPHYDDIALSAGATVSLLSQHGLTPETLVVFGSPPDLSRPLTPFAQAMHDGWGLTADQVVASRQAEEAAAAAVLGARTSVLPFRDAIYRGDLYRSDNDLFGHPAAAEAALPASIIDSLHIDPAEQRQTRIYAPLAIGQHVDHQIVFQAGVNLAAAGWDVWFYEDLPYALQPGAVQMRLTGIEAPVQLEVAAVIPAARGWDQKIDAILAYPSQLDTIFRQYVGVGTSREEISTALAEYAARVGDRNLSERYWRVDKASSNQGS